MGVSPELSEDGIKSILRAHSPQTISQGLLLPAKKLNYQWTLKKMFFYPYWSFKGKRMIQ